MRATTCTALMISALVGASILLVSCASVADPATPPVEWRKGAKRGWIARVYAPASPRAELPECLQALSSAELAQRRFALVGYWRARHSQFTVAELSDGLAVSIDDTVEVLPADCETGHFARVTRKLGGVWP